MVENIERNTARRNARLMISYSRKDKEFVKRLYDTLVGEGFVPDEIWVDWEGIALSADWMAEITKGIRSADAFLFVISPDSVTSEVCKREIDLAVESNKRFIPILHREPGKDAKLHEKISSHNWVFIRDEQELNKTLSALIKAINTDLNWLARHTRLFNKAKEWDENGRNDSYLVRGNDLRDAETFIGEGATGKEPAPTILHVEYVRAARQFAAAVRRRIRIIAAVVGMALLALSIFSLIQWGIAEAETVRANDNASTAVAEQVRADNNAATAQANAVIAENNAIIAENNAVIAEENARAANALALASESIIQKGNDTQLSLMLALLSIQETQQDGFVLPESQFALFSSLNIPNVLYTLPRHDDWVRSVAFDPTGVYFATGSLSGKIRVWSLESGELIRTIEQNGEVYGLDFSPDGSQLGIATRVWNGNDYDGLAKVWNVLSGDEIFNLIGHAGAVNDIAFSPDGKYIATGGRDGTIKLWFADLGSLKVTMFNNRSSVQTLDFSPDGSLLVSGSTDRNAVLWDVESSSLLRTLRGHEATVSSVAFNPWGDRVITGGFDRDAIVWNVADGSKLQTLTGNYSAVLGVDYAPDGLSMLTASSGVKIWEYFYGTERFNLAAHRGEVLAATYSQDGQYILTGSSDYTAKLWANFLMIDNLKMKDNVGRNLDANYSHDGKWIVTADEWGNILVHDAQTGEVFDQWNIGDARVNAAAFDPQDNQRIVTGDANGQVLVWNRGNAQPAMVIDAHTDSVSSVVFSLDGGKILSASDDGTAKVWDASNGDLQLALVDEDGFPVYDARFSDDGGRIVTSSQDTTAKIWDAVTGNMLMQLVGHTDFVNAAVFSHDGSRVYTASDDNTIKTWDTATGEQLQNLTGHTGFVYSLDLSPDGALLVSGGADSTVKVWDLSNGREIYNYLGNNEDTNSVVFSPDGNKVLTASSDETTKEFTIDYDILLEISQEYELRPLTPEECQRFLFRDDCTLTLFGQTSSNDQVSALPVVQVVLTPAR